MTQPSRRRSESEALASAAPLRGAAARRWRTLLPAGLLLTLLLTGLAAALLNRAFPPAPELGGGTVAALRDGSWAAAYQRAFDADSALREPAVTVWGVLGYALFGEGEPGVLVGEGGWLHTREEFVWPAGAEAALEENLDRIADVRERLATEGVALVAVLVPAKARLHPETLGRYSLPDGPAARYEAALAGLAARGVTAVDGAAPLAELKRAGGSPFLRTDTHWTPEGAAAVAAATAATVRAEAPFTALGGTPYELTVHPPEPHRGDLTTFLRLGPLYDRLGPPDDPLVRRETVSAAPPSNDLFAAVEIPVVLVGTSYSADPRWGFAGALGLELGAEVLGAARAGAGPFEPMTRYLDGDAIRTSPPEVIVWEIPERYLSVSSRGAPAAGRASTLEARP